MKKAILTAFTAILILLIPTQAKADFWGTYSNFGLNFSDDVFNLQVGRSPIREDSGTNIDYGATIIGHYENDSVDDAKLRVERWSAGAFIRYPLLHFSGTELNIQGKAYIDAALVLDTDTMEDWYTPIGVSGHILLDRKLTEEGRTIWEVFAVGGYQYISNIGLYGDNNVGTLGLVIRWRDKPKS